MQTIELSSLDAETPTLSTEGTTRIRQLHRLIDQQATTAAAAALKGAANRTRSDESILAAALAAADAVLSAPGDDAARDELGAVAASHGFMKLIPELVAELRWTAGSHPDSGACLVGSTLDLWSWTMNHYRANEGDGAVLDELGGILGPILAARCLVLDVAKRATTDTADLELLSDLSQVYAGRTSATTGAACAELVFGYQRHMVWDEEGCGACYESDDLDDLEAVIPGFASGAGITNDIIKADGSHPAKRGPCVRVDGLEAFSRLRNKLDGCLAGVRIAKDRAAASIARSTADTKGGRR